MAGNRTPEGSPDAEPSEDSAPNAAADTDASETGPIEGMEGAAVTVGPGGEIALDRSAPGGPPPSDRPDRSQPPEPDQKPLPENNVPTAVNEEPSG
ncbi:MAG TPA: hypothetical protein VFZ32_12070 [Micromonosporaceae bacterium]